MSFRYRSYQDRSPAANTVCKISPPWWISDGHNELAVLCNFNVSRQRCRLFADYNIALGILSKLSKQNDRSPTIADISRFLRQVLVSHAQRPRTNKPFPSKHLLCNELHEPFKQQSHKRSGRSLADTQRNLRSRHNEVLCDFLSIMAFTIRGMQTSVSCAVVLVHSMRNASMPVLLPCRFQRTCQSTTSGS